LPIIGACKGIWQLKSSWGETLITRRSAPYPMIYLLAGSFKVPDKNALIAFAINFVGLAIGRIPLLSSWL